MSNQKTGRHQSLQEHFRLYDAMHPRLREVLRRAPYDYFVRAGDAELRGADVEARRRQLISAMMDDIGRDALKTWGPDHPQAAPPPARRRGR